MDTTIFTSTGEQYTAVCKVRRPNSWSWTLANYTSKPVELGFGFPTPTKLEWTASEGGETPLPGTEALPKKIYTHRLSDRVRTWSGANAACPKGEAQAADRWYINASPLLPTVLDPVYDVPGIRYARLVTRYAQAVPTSRAPPRRPRRCKGHGQPR